MSGGVAPLRMGTRRSPLAVRQTEIVQRHLLAHGIVSHIVPLDTLGDTLQNIPLPSFGAPAVFTRALDDALRRGTIDIAVHSLKDLPTEPSRGITLAAVSEREDPSEALVGRGMLRWNSLPPYAILATSSLRRRAQLLRARPDLRVVDIRGNIGTRLRKLDDTLSWTGILIASAGLVRLGYDHRIGERLTVPLILPAPGQGALGITARVDDVATVVAVRDAVEHTPTRLSTTAEREFLRRLAGGCHAPIAAYGRFMRLGRKQLLRIDGRILSLDGVRIVEGFECAPVRDVADAVALGAHLAARLLEQGGADILSTLPVPAVAEVS